MVGMGWVDLLGGRECQEALLESQVRLGGPTGGPGGLEGPCGEPEGVRRAKRDWESPPGELGKVGGPSGEPQGVGRPS